MTQPFTDCTMAEDLFTPAPDPRCPESCPKCKDLPYGPSVRREQHDMTATALRADAIVDRILLTQAKTPPEQYELRDMACAVRVFGFGLASVLGLLLDRAPELAHDALAMYQEMYTNGGVYYTQELYDEVEAELAAKAATPAPGPVQLDAFTDETAGAA